MTEFSKVDLPHISNLPTLTTHNLRLENGIDLTFISSEHQYHLLVGENFSLIFNLNTKLWFQSQSDAFANPFLQIWSFVTNKNVLSLKYFFIKNNFLSNFVILSPMFCNTLIIHVCNKMATTWICSGKLAFLLYKYIRILGLVPCLSSSRSVAALTF